MFHSNRSIQSLDIFQDLEESVRHDIEGQARRISLANGKSAPPLMGDEVVLVLAGSVVVTGTQPNPGKIRLQPGEFIADSCPGANEIRLEIRAEGPTELAILPRNALPLNLRQRVMKEILTRVLSIELASTAMFRELAPEEIAGLAAKSECLSLVRGDRLILEGEPQDGLYVSLRGSLEIYRRREDGSIHSIHVTEPGDCVGEMSLLSENVHSASVRARRHSAVLKIPLESWETIQRQAPVILHIAKLLSRRLKQTTTRSSNAPGIESIALVPWCDPPAFRDFARCFAEAFARAGYRAATFEPLTTMASDQFGALLDGASAENDYTIFICSEGGSEWNESVLREADLILFVGSLDARPTGKLPPVAKEARNAGAQVEFALVRGEQQTPSGTLTWLNRAPFDAHHHLVSGRHSDFDRLLRRISGKAWGLVLGGGGARGLAHIGVIRAFEEADIPIDMICGSSMGAIIAAQYASGLNSKQILDVTRGAYTGGSSVADMTIPLVAMRTGGGTIARLREIFGERNIEDLPIPYFCATCNLTRAVTAIQERGPVALWTRVSCSVPGLLPPVAWHGDLLADGALLDNLPVAAMRERMRGQIAASDVSVRVDLSVSPGMPPEPRWSGVAQVFRKALGKPSLPNIGSLLMRTAEIGTIRDARLAGRPADLYLQQPVDEFSMSDFAAIDGIVDLGYQYTADRLQKWRAGQS